MTTAITKIYCIIVLVLGTLAGNAATVNWSAGIDHGFSLVGGAQVSAGSLVRLGHFRDPDTGAQLSDTQIQALAGNPALLDLRFVEAATSTVGTGVSGMDAHFTAASAVDTAALNLVGKQMYLWVLNAPSLGEATQQAILYWDISDDTNPDATPTRPALRWAFPAELPVPGTTGVDVTDLTAATTTLGTGARLVIGSFPTGTSSNTTAPNFGLAIISNVLNINTAALPTGVRNTPYSQTFVATGSTDPLTWSVSAGALPDGLSLDAQTGQLSGTPTTVGVSTFTVQVNAGALITSKQFSLQITNSALAILTTSLADALVDQNYSITLSADGGIAPYVWIRTTGSLPPGLILGEDGIISGTSTAPGTHTFSVSVSDQSDQVVERAFTLVTTYTPVIEGDSTLVPGVRRIPYSRQFVIPDGRSYAWSVTNGALPPGMRLSTSGRLTGISPTAGTYTFTITATGPDDIVSSRQFSLTILDANLAPTLQTPEFPDTMVGSTGYRYQVVASPYPSRISIVGLPPGLRVDPATGWVTGNATTPGTFVAAVRATNAAGSSAMQYASIVVKGLPTGSVGTFNAIVAPVQEVNGLLGGSIQLTTTITGGYSLTLTQGASVFRSKGTLSTQIGSLSPRVIASVGRLRFNLIIDSINDNLVGTVSAVAADGSLTPAAVNGWRQTWDATNTTHHLSGRYSAGIDLTSHFDIETVPQGAGWIVVNADTKGRATVTGRTAAGDVITGNSIVSRDNRLLVYSRLNKNLGVIQGVLQVNSSPAGVESNALIGSLVWRKSTSPTTVYPTAFGPLTVAVSGGYLNSLYNASVAWGYVLGLPAAGDQSSLIFTKGGLAGASINPNVDPFTFSRSLLKGVHVLTSNLPAPGTVFNLGRTTLTVTPRSGLVAGGFTLRDGTRVRRANFSGVVVRTPDNTLKAQGYFLLPKLPQFGEKGRPQVLSGKFTITQP